MGRSRRQVELRLDVLGPGYAEHSRLQECFTLLRPFADASIVAALDKLYTGILMLSGCVRNQASTHTSMHACPSFCLQLFEKLKDNTSVTSVDLSANQISDAGAEVRADWKLCPSLIL